MLVNFLVEYFLNFYFLFDSVNQNLVLSQTSENEVSDCHANASKKQNPEIVAHQQKYSMNNQHNSMRQEKYTNWNFFFHRKFKFFLRFKIWILQQLDIFLENMETIWSDSSSDCDVPFHESKHLCENTHQHYDQIACNKIFMRLNFSWFP